MSARDGVTDMGNGLIKRVYVPVDPRMQAAFLCLDIQEDETVMKGRARFKGNAQLQRIIEYLINTAE